MAPDAVAKTIASMPKAPKTVLIVRFPDGTVIYEAKAADTFAKTLEKLGLDKVAALGLKVNNFPLVSREPCEGYQQTALGGYRVMSHSNTASKRNQLLTIAGKLRQKLNVDIVPAGETASDAQTLLAVGCEGGRVALVGVEHAVTWQFRVESDDSTLNGFLDEDDRLARDADRGVTTGPPWVASWDEALEQLDQNPWPHLYPLEVHPGFRDLIKAAFV